jgi:photosystem II stability/assembly factor-like uncharacterized protein
MAMETQLERPAVPVVEAAVDEERPVKSKQQLRRELVDKMLGTSDRLRLVREIDRARARRGAMHDPERASADPGTKLAKTVEIVGEGGITATRMREPREWTSIGVSSPWIAVKAKRPFAAATLRFKLGRTQLARLDPDTILVGRWDEAEERFRLIPQSGFNADGGYAYARITRPGTYAAVGLPRDPRLRTTLKLMAVMQPWQLRDQSIDFHERICQVILCNPDTAKLVKSFTRTGKGLGELGFGRDDFLGWEGDGATICDRCLGLGGAGRLVELDILDVLQEPPHVLKPWPLPLVWPRGCPSWKSIGPTNVPGRINALAVHPTNGARLFAGAAAGGVFTTVNGGIGWKPRWHGQLSLAIGGIGVAASNPSIVYAATGEWENNVGATNNHFPGVGVYRSTDGGSAWDLLAPIPSANTAAVAVDPTDPDRVFVAGDTGLHRSTNGGASWDVAPGETYGVFDGVISDVVVDPANPSRLFIGVHGSGIWRSTDGGNTWSQLSNGIPTGAAADSPKIALGRNGPHGTNFVAVKMGHRVFTSPNGGTHFNEQANCGAAWSFIPWANVIAVDPEDEDVLLGGHANLYRSTNGGSSWTQVGGYGTNVHPDQQAVVFDLTDHDHVYVATDGGVYESTDNGQTWTPRSDGLVTTQCWTVGVSEGSTLAYGITTQDNSCYEWSGVGTTFSQIIGPEGGWIEYDPSNPQTIYADTWFASLNKSVNGGTSWTALSPNTDAGIKESLAIANGNPSLLLIAQGNSVRRSTNGGTTWTTTLSPGVPISAIEFAPSSDQHAYAGSDNGRVWRTTNGGQTWTELTTSGVLPAGRIHDIEIDWSDPLRIYLAFGTVGVRQCWRGDVGAGSAVTWHDVTGALPAVSLPDLALTGLALHPTLDETIYVSNILGVYRSIDGGESWAPFDDGLPNAFVSDLDVRKHDRSLYASTMGRGLYRRYV